MLWNNPSVCCGCVLLPLVNKKAVWPTTRQNKSIQKSQTENSGKKRAESERSQPATGEVRCYKT